MNLNEYAQLSIANMCQNKSISTMNISIRRNNGSVSHLCSTSPTQYGSPMPEIKCSLFKEKSRKTSTRNNKRSSRPSLETDLKKYDSPDEDKENTGLSERLSGDRRRMSFKDTNVFRFSTTQVGDCSLPKLMVQQCEDDVFSDLPGSCSPVPNSSRLLLTPSTAHTPLYLGARSPHLSQGLCCSTPSRLKLEKEGLDMVVDKLVLGKGAYGTVVLGQWMGKKVAVKVIERAEETNKIARRRKSLESELLAAKLDHENIVKIYGVHAQDDNHAVIVMEYVGSRNLHRLLVEQKEKPLSKSWLINAAQQVASGLAHCHSRRIVHLDIKPANILVTSSGVCKLGDFGCSISLDDSIRLKDIVLVGTPGYQAPEFLRGSVPTPACDVYSLGILLWQLDSREIPYSGQHPQTVMFRVVSAGARPDVPSSSSGSLCMPAFTSLYKNCWSGEPVNRFSASAIVNKLVNMRGEIGGARRTQGGYLMVRTMR